MLVTLQDLTASTHASLASLPLLTLRWPSTHASLASVFVYTTIPKLN